MKLLIGTNKGLITYEKQAGVWQQIKDDFVGLPVSMVYTDKRNGTWWAGISHGHWGQKLHRSKDAGQTWEEVPVPKYPPGAEVKPGIPASLRLIWSIMAGGADEPGKLYIGTEPGGLFVSEDGGDSWALAESLWHHPSRMEHWFGAGRDHAGIHSICVDPRDSSHVYLGVSCAGVFETRDGGAIWQARNKGVRADYLPDPNVEVGQDPHRLLICENHPDTLWQQNHCGIWVSHDGAATWQDVTAKDQPANFGFALALDASNPKRAWVVPAVSDYVRVAVEGALCVCRTDDGGKSWMTFREGLPQQHCYDIVYRHSLVRQGKTLVFGTTTGNLFVSENDGVTWSVLSHHLAGVNVVSFV